ncbi:tetraspanin-19 [Lampris incognitus]|uniref:tetraspanin-19 n=1 Tax=Lampris incognitus TaxID=2546036 RepID=UPI0024B4DA0A|nr:tetraspanin-19 [Lampris incognitus]
MKLEDKIQVLKFCSAVFSTIFLILGVSIFSCALWILFDKGTFLSVFDSEELKMVAGGLFVVGLLVVVASVVGWIGSHLEMRVFLLLYVAFLIILILGQLFITLILLVNRDKIKGSLDEAVDLIIKNYGNGNEEERADRLLDKVQHSAECCGRRDPVDWLTNSLIQSMNLTSQVVLPCSCFNDSRCPVLADYNNSLFGTGNFSYTEGCEKKLRDWLEENTFTIVGMVMGLVLIQVVQFVLAVNLYQNLGWRARLKRTAGLIAAVNTDPASESASDGFHMGDGEQNLGFIEPEDGFRAEGLGHPDQFHDNQNRYHPKNKFGL